MLALRLPLGGGSRRSQNRRSSPTLGSLSLLLFPADWSRLPGCTPGDHRPHVREGLAPPPGAASAHHWLRLAETRMSTGMRGARGRALCSGRGACALAAFQREVGRGRRAGACSGLSWRGPGKALKTHWCRSRVSEGPPRGVRAGWSGRRRVGSPTSTLIPNHVFQSSFVQRTVLWRVGSRCPIILDLSALYFWTCSGEQW